MTDDEERESVLNANALGEVLATFHPYFMYSTNTIYINGVSTTPRQARVFAARLVELADEAESV